MSGQNGRATSPREARSLPAESESQAPDHTFGPKVGVAYSINLIFGAGFLGVRAICYSICAGHELAAVLRMKE